MENITLSVSDCGSLGELLRFAEVAPVGMAIALDPGCREMVVNRVARTALAVAAGQNISRSAPADERAAEFRHFIDGRETDSDELPLQVAVRENRTIGPVDVTILCWDETTIRSRVMAAPFHDETGALVGGLAIYLDILSGETRVRGRAPAAAGPQLGSAYTVLAEALPELIWVTDGNAHPTYFNGRWYTYTGLTPEESFAPLGWLRAVHPEDREPTMDAVGRAIRDGKVFEIEYRLFRSDGVPRWFLARGLPQRDGTGALVSWFGSSTDIHDAKRVALQARALEEVAGEPLDGDLRGYLRRIAHTVVSAIGSFCIVDALDPQAGLVRVGFAHVDATLESALAEVVFRFVPRLEHADHPIVRSIRTRATHVYDATQLRESFANAPLMAEHRRVLEALAPLSAIVVPIFGADREIVGVLSFGESRPERGDFDTSDIAFAEQIGERVSRMLESVRRHEDAHRVAINFQQASLPRELPLVDGLAFDVLYLAGRAEALVGGDWYDAFRMSDGRIGVSIGDVAGSGVDSAVTMASLRQSIRAISSVFPNPVAVLTGTDSVLRAQYPERFATAFFGIYDPATRRLQYALCGHPPPLLRDPAGGVEELSAPAAPPLGLFDLGGAPNAVSVEIAPGSLLVLFTDGLIECERDMARTEQRLLRAVSELDDTVRPAQAILDAVCGAVRPSDDVAVLTVRFASQ